MDDETVSQEDEKDFGAIGKWIVAGILEQNHIGNWAKVTITRNKANVVLSWEYLPKIKNPSNIEVTIGVREITLEPDPSYGLDRYIHRSCGNGSVQMTLEEGFAYHFSFMFSDLHSEANDSSWPEDNKEGPQFVDIVHAQVAIPLSDKKRVLLRNAIKNESDIVDRIHHTAEVILKKEEAYTDACKNGIGRIRARHLSSKEEDEQTQRFLDQMEQKKEEWGL